MILNLKFRHSNSLKDNYFHQEMIQLVFEPNQQATKP